MKKRVVNRVSFSKRRQSSYVPAPPHSTPIRKESSRYFSMKKRTEVYMQTQSYIHIFERREKKYLLSDEQYLAMRKILEKHTVPDEYEQTEIYNTYYDTPDFLLIRRSLDKPLFKEKLRVRTYCKPAEDTAAFIEVKRKYDDTVYKRRFSMPYVKALKYMRGSHPLIQNEDPENKQISREIDYALCLYRGLRPAMEINYSRIALVGAYDSSLRITFDSNLRCKAVSDRDSDSKAEIALLPDGQRIMEIKVCGAVPLWLTHILTELHLSPSSFSKYGKAFEMLVTENGFHIPEQQNFSEKERNTI